MKTQILPNWCKKLGLALLIIFSVITGIIDGLMSGCNVECSPKNSSQLYSTNIEITDINPYFGEETTHYFNIISYFGILIYMLSKEKIEDDYITQLRLESYQFTALFGIIISIVLYAFSKEIRLGIEDFIQLFMYVYLITFFFKKRIY